MIVAYLVGFNVNTTSLEEEGKRLRVRQKVTFITMATEGQERSGDILGFPRGTELMEYIYGSLSSINSHDRKVPQ